MSTTPIASNSIPQSKEEFEIYFQEAKNRFRAQLAAHAKTHGLGESHQIEPHAQFWEQYLPWVLDTLDGLQLKQGDHTRFEPDFYFKDAATNRLIFVEATSRSDTDPLATPLQDESPDAPFESGIMPSSVSDMITDPLAHRVTKKIHSLTDSRKQAAMMRLASEYECLDYLAVIALNEAHAVKNWAHEATKAPIAGGLPSSVRMLFGLRPQMHMDSTKPANINYTPDRRTSIPRGQSVAQTIAGHFIAPNWQGRNTDHIAGVLVSSANDEYLLPEAFRDHTCYVQNPYCSARASGLEASCFYSYDFDVTRNQIIPTTRTTPGNQHTVVESSGN
jgi:hypothetical protein